MTDVKINGILFMTAITISIMSIAISVYTISHRAGNKLTTAKVIEVQEDVTDSNSIKDRDNGK